MEHFTKRMTIIFSSKNDISPHQCQLVRYAVLKVHPRTHAIKTMILGTKYKLLKEAYPHKHIPTQDIL